MTYIGVEVFGMTGTLCPVGYNIRTHSGSNVWILESIPHCSSSFSHNSCQCVDSGGYMLMNRLCAVIAAWLNGSHRKQNFAIMNQFAGG